MNVIENYTEPSHTRASMSRPDFAFTQNASQSPHRDTSRKHAEHSVPCRERLFAEFQPLVRRLIRQYGETAERRDDLTGEIYYRFCVLVDAYDPGRGVPLRPYLVHQLNASVYTYARQQWRICRREVSLDAAAASASPFHAYDPVADWDHALSLENVRHTLAEAISELPERQRKVLTWRYYEDRSFEQIAHSLQIEQSSARSLLRHGLNKLRALSVLPAYVQTV